MTIPTEETAAGWRPLSRREANLPDSPLREGVPKHLDRPLREWVASVLDVPTAQLLGLRLGMSTTDPWSDPENIAAGLDTLPDPDRGEVGPVEVLAEYTEAEQLLDVIDAVIGEGLTRWAAAAQQATGNAAAPPWARALAALSPTAGMMNGFAGRVQMRLLRLEQLLAEGRSVYRVNRTSRRLERRLDPTVTAAADAAMAAGNPGRHLALAWAAAYDRQPNPSRAYDEAVRAVEAAAIPVVLPNDPKATLGKVIGELDSHSGRWRLAIDGDDAGNVGPLIGMLQLLWRGHVGRHAGGPNNRPNRPAEAEMAVHLAATLVQWFAAGTVHQRVTP